MILLLLVVCVAPAMGINRAQNRPYSMLPNTNHPLRLHPQMSFLNLVPNCHDNPGYGSLCAWWAASGECEWNWHFMLKECRFSCGICSALSRIPKPCGYSPDNSTNPGSGLLVHFPNFPIFPFPSNAAHLHLQKADRTYPQIPQYPAPSAAHPAPSSGYPAAQPSHHSSPPAAQSRYVPPRPTGMLLHKVGEMPIQQALTDPNLKIYKKTPDGPLRPLEQPLFRAKRQLPIASNTILGKCAEETEQRVLFGGNRAMLHGLTKEACKIECYHERSFICKAAVYYTITRSCLLYDFNGEENPDRVLPAEDGDVVTLIDVTTKPVPECPRPPPRQPIFKCVTLMANNSVLFGGNIAMREDISLEKCKESCLDTSSQSCIAGVWYGARNTCLLYDYNDLTKPERITPSVPEEKAVYFRVETGAPNCPVGGGCDSDQDTLCHFWASTGQCTVNPLWMLPNCPVSCMITDIANKS